MTVNTDRSTFRRRRAGGELGLDQVADLPLGFRPQDVHRPRRDLPCGELVLAQESAHLGTVAVRQDENLPAGGDLGEHRYGLVHLGTGLLPRTAPSGTVEGVPSEGDQNPRHGPRSGHLGPA